ncbi:MAG: hypothetical protein M1501_01005 [Candidatus Omnitrophica bacterium]|nr:hypothetical protein [Candidatus Omnitrophota bacterium]
MIVINSFSYGLILHSFTKAKEEKLEMFTAISSSLKYFKPLFIYNLILVIIPSIIQFLMTLFSISNIYANNFWFRFLNWSLFILGWIFLFFIFVPFYIVLKNNNWREAFKQNFLLWKIYLPETLTLIIFYVIAAWIFIQFPNIILFAISFIPLIFHQFLILFLILVINFWFTGVICQFVDKTSF